jgi:hypothetical protein
VIVIVIAGFAERFRDPAAPDFVTRLRRIL